MCMRCSTWYKVSLALLPSALTSSLPDPKPAHSMGSTVPDSRRDKTRQRQQNGLMKEVEEEEGEEEVEEEKIISLRRHRSLPGPARGSRPKVMAVAEAETMMQAVVSKITTVLQQKRDRDSRPDNIMVSTALTQSITLLYMLHEDFEYICLVSTCLSTTMLSISVACFCLCFVFVNHCNSL